ncbi:hypothetical protein ACHAXA_000130 [Cyclostephanos tholiformis]|jgi:hypothetical protein|uniref:Uncharacterized protein n=1 Tax=Cyclostephanos tholiformis TaxID=382380 RepID=A0ABD3RXX5_9STRA
MVNETQSYTVPTSKTTTPKCEDIDLRTLGEGDLESLRTEDAFMYHSIPGILKARLSLTEVDHSRVLDGARQEANTIVSRKSRVSTEGESMLSLEDLNFLLADDADDNDVPIPPEHRAASPETNDNGRNQGDEAARPDEIEDHINNISGEHEKP